MHMQIRSKNKKYTKSALIVTSILVLLLAGYAVVASQKDLWPFIKADNINLTPTNDDEKSTGDQIKSDSIKTEDKGTPPTDKPQPTDSISVSITSKSQGSSTYRIGTIIDSILGSGTCTLVLSKDGQASYEATVDIQAGPSTSTCKGFTVPLSSLSSGTWTATISVNSGSLTGTTSQAITIE